MKTRKLAAVFILVAALFGGAIPATANENLSQVQTTLSNTSLSGYVDSSVEWESQPPASESGNSWWWDILVWFGIERG